MDQTKAHIEREPTGLAAGLGLDPTEGIACHYGCPTRFAVACRIVCQTCIRMCITIAGHRLPRPVVGIVVGFPLTHPARQLPTTAGRWKHCAEARASRGGSSDRCDPRACHFQRR